jgi:hypothetical protein
MPSEQRATVSTEKVGTASAGESGHIAIAADLLAQMIRQLQGLARTYPTLRVAMATAARELQEKMRTLHILVEEIAVIDDPTGVAERTSIAKSVISRLAWEVERLAIHVEHTGLFLGQG